MAPTRDPGAKAHTKIKIDIFDDGSYRFDSYPIIHVRLPDQRLLRVISRSLLFAMMLLTLPYIGCLRRGGPSYLSESRVPETASYVVDAKFLDTIFHDLFREGLVRKGDHALAVIPSMKTSIVGGNHVLNSSKVNLLIASNLEKENPFHGRKFDAVFLFGSEDAKSVDRVVKVGGLLVSSNTALKRPNYNVVYLRQYESTIVAMRKMFPQQEDAAATSRKLLNDRKAVLEGLESVYLEPPRMEKARSRKAMTQKFHYLPELLHDNLGGYRRRVFVEVVSPEEEKGVAVSWFKENYPMGNQKFEVHSVGNEESDVSRWLQENVREEDFVVVKAGAGVVEEMMKRKALALVEELFLECNCEWGKKAKAKKKKTTTTRAYWECLNLYGRVRDEGVAVHQWWG